jgi:hypothetical protein
LCALDNPAGLTEHSKKVFCVHKSGADCIDKNCVNLFFPLYLKLLFKFQRNPGSSGEDLYNTYKEEYDRYVNSDTRGYDSSDPWENDIHFCGIFMENPLDSMVNLYLDRPDAEPVLSDKDMTMLKVWFDKYKAVLHTFQHDDNSANAELYAMLCFVLSHNPELVLETIEYYLSKLYRSEVERFRNMTKTTTLISETAAEILWAAMNKVVATGRFCDFLQFAENSDLLKKRDGGKLHPRRQIKLAREKLTVCLDTLFNDITSLCTTSDGKPFAGRPEQLKAAFQRDFGKYYTNLSKDYSDYFDTP